VGLAADDRRHADLLGPADLGPRHGCPGGIRDRDTTTARPAPSPQQILAERFAWLRHPQYAGFLLVMTGLLVQWPTIPTLAMFPVLTLLYRRLARTEETEVAAAFGPAWADYAARVPPFLPRRPHPPATPARRPRPADATRWTAPAGE